MRHHSIHRLIIYVIVQRPVGMPIGIKSLMLVSVMIFHIGAQQEIGVPRDHYASCLEFPQRILLVLGDVAQFQYANTYIGIKNRV